MTRLYLKIFLTFWLITGIIIVGTNVVVHWFDIAPEGGIKSSHLTRSEEPAKRFLFQMAGSVINRTQTEIRNDLAELPAWSARLIFALDDNEQDLLHRQLPPGVLVLANQITPLHPYEKIQDRNRKLFARYITLNDGNSIKLITISEGYDEGPDRDIILDLFIANIWPLLLVSILVSGTACFILARHFTSSIKHLQETIQQVAAGDLSARVSKYFFGRKDEIATLGQDFDKMTARLEKAMQEQKRLIKDVSHELRTPLARLQFALAIAQQRSNGLVDAELERIKQAADYLGNIVTEILSLPVHDQHAWQLDDTLDLHALLENIRENYLQMASEKSIEIILKTDCHEALVPTHGNLLFSVFENILRNAIQYSALNTRVEIILEQDEINSRYKVIIKDSGPGVPKELLADIFEPFFRTDEARDRESGGYGLGLAIAHRNVALHYGKIWAENRLTKGLKIIVELPASNA